MEPCTYEEQMRFWIYNLETACKMADDAGTSKFPALPLLMRHMFLKLSLLATKNANV